MSTNISLTIFANFRINEDERFLRLKDSFFSFRQMRNAKWVINIRGKLKKEVASFLKEQLKEDIVLFELESEEGWFNDSRKMLSFITTDFVLFWVEDQVNQIYNFGLYEEILSELNDNGVDFFPYSHFGVCKSYHVVTGKNLKRIKVFDLTKKNWKLVHKYSRELYILYIPAIFKREFFNKIINDDDLRQNVKWPKQTPFNFEKNHRDTHWLPFKMAIPFSELCVNIDEDHLGYSLITRGRYPQRIETDIRAGGAKPEYIRITFLDKASIISKRILQLFLKYRNSKNSSL